MTNEQRAHEFALMWVDNVLKENVDPFLDDENSKNRLFQEYNLIYKKVLRLILEDDKLTEETNLSKT